MCPSDPVSTVSTSVLPSNILSAAIPVKFAPLIAGNAAVKLAAGILVQFVAAPLNEVAVTTPVTSIPCEFAVTAEPTTIDVGV